MTKPERYQYGAWRAVITLSADILSQARPEVMTGLRFPKLPHRLIIADRKEKYGCAAAANEGEFEPGFAFINGISELDVYSYGEAEDFNPTSLREVAAALSEIADERLRPYVV
ncbi:hypothetical protein SJI19_00480 [Acerihabitans sp. TG2]|uniref:hypothetical protein n=1 Tax=Acerihabitans sp. TG2 TaxID=3096008 RepID=UPI002B2339F9|nr:hypothetical protein [Acerihabitans sp. TG2]MEA9389045.1 hypothetical protein [Acerihabitans sp. TG2]